MTMFNLPAAQRAIPYVEISTEMIGPLMADISLFLRRRWYRPMRAMLILSLTVTISSALVTKPVDGVVEGEPQRITRVNAGRNVWKIMAVGDDVTYRHWLSVCLDLPAGEALRSACVAELRRLKS